MDQPKKSVIDALNMSLDDYIKESGIKIERKNFRKQNYESMDLSEQLIPNASSMQWRLLDPNRTVGMAPLIPIGAPVSAKPASFRANRNNHRNRFKVNRKDQANFKKRNQNHVFSRLQLSTNSPTNNSTSTAVIPSNTVGVINTISQGLLSMATCATTDFYGNIVNELMKNFVKKQEKEKEKYNMALQKDISSIQGKPFIYASNSGGKQTVVSFDGPGVDDCKVNVASTNTTMNQRFA